MNGKIKRLISLMLCAVLLLSVLPCGAAAADIQSGSITQMEDGYCFTSFADLQELAAGTYDSWTGAFYTGEAALVISEDLTIPANLCLYFESYYGTEPEIIVNAGVTFEMNDYCTGGKWTVNGTLINQNEMANIAGLTVNGSLINYGWLRPGSGSTVSGLENITNRDYGYITWTKRFSDVEGLMELLAEAQANPRNDYEFGADFEAENIHVVITEDLTIPANVWLHGETNFSITVSQGAALRVDGSISLYGGTLIVDGTLKNNSSLHLGWMNDGTYHYGTLRVNATGSYTGYGELYVYAGEHTSYADSITGLDLSRFTVETAEYEGEVYNWVLYIPGEEVVESPFTDVISGKYYYDATMWAVESGVTAGKTETTFAPDENCTRAQVVTFLWRAAGSPEPTITDHNFTDVNPTAFYYKAMLWAVEEGITQGMTATTFGPSEKCSRAQVVTFIWRTAGKPEAESDDHPFTDVNAENFYYKAMLWAVQNGITAGASANTFNPSGICTRGQVVTFLYRLFG